MKCSVTSSARFNKSRTVLTLGTANVFIALEGLQDAHVVVPVQLKSVARNGKQGNPFIDVRQPQYQDKRSGKYRTSYLSVHLDGTGAKAVEALVSADWLKGEVKRLWKSDKAGDYELGAEGKWEHKGDRAFTSIENAEDEDWLSDVVGTAEALAAKAQEAASKAQATETKSSDTVEALLGSAKK